MRCAGWMKRFSDGALGALLATSATLAALVCGPAAAYEGHFEVLTDHKVVTVNSDHTYTASIVYRYRVLTEKGAQDGGRTNFSYSTRHEAFKLLYARTLKPDGTVRNVTPDAIQTQDGIVGDGFSASMLDYKVLFIPYPDVQKGDVIEIAYERRLTVPWFKDRLYYWEGQGIEMAVRDARFTLNMPKGYAFTFAQNGYAQASDETRDGRRVVTWQYTRAKPGELEPGSIDTRLLAAPHIQISNFKDWADVARSYEARAAGKTRVTETVRKLAQEIVGTETAPRAVTVRLYDWVRANIRYVAAYVGTGGFVPRDVDAIASTRWGDCKDHVTLLEALLAARGIEASTVLISADYENYQLPIVPSPAVFNHVISYLPALDMYLDSTSRFSVFGSLPRANMAKPVLHTKTGKIAATPRPAPQDAFTRREVNVELTADGSATGKILFDAHGIAADLMREEAMAIGEGREVEWVRKQLRRAGYEGEGTVTFTDMAPQENRMQMRASFAVRNFKDFAEADRFLLSSVLEPPLSMLSGSASVTLKQREFPFWCGPVAVDDDWRYTFPAGIKVVYLGKPLQLNKGRYRVDASLKQEGQTVVLRRTATAEPGSGGAWCAPAQYAEEKSTVETLTKRIGARVIFAPAQEIME